MKNFLKNVVLWFGKINLTQIFAVIFLILGAWSGAGVLAPEVILMLTAFFTLIFKLWSSSRELASTGIGADWALYITNVVGLIVGFADTVVNAGWLTSWFGDGSKYIIMIYLAINIIIRTWFTNQSLNSVAARKG